MWSIYDTIISSLPGNEYVQDVLADDAWFFAQTDNGNAGIAMTIPDNTIQPLFLHGLVGMEAKAAAAAVKSWNLYEASAAMAVINSCYNTIDRMEALNCEEPYENYCTRGIEFAGKTVGVIGHLRIPEEILSDAKKVYILERAPQSGDYPDSACDFILPGCDVVLITGSTLENKTLPHLLELCKNAYTILTGPTVPMCPELLRYGIERLAGMVVTDAAALRERIEQGKPGSPYPYGQSFLLEDRR